MLASAGVKKEKVFSSAVGSRLSVILGIADCPRYSAGRSFLEVGNECIENPDCG